MDHAIELRRAGKAKEAVDLIFAPETNDKRDELRKNSAALIWIIEKLKTTAQEKQRASEARACHQIGYMQWGVGANRFMGWE
jgi:hypothetical protein